MMKFLQYFKHLYKRIRIDEKPKKSTGLKNQVIDFMSVNPKYEKYEIGEWTYGNPNIKAWDEKTNLRIGKFCSIAGNVQFLLGGEHRADWITTYPFNEVMDEAREYQGHPASKGDIIIGNDVWIGQNAIILSGVNIGNGAVIGAGSVVSKDVSAYAIAVGNPARITRYRFSQEQIIELEKIQWWEWSLEEIRNALPLLLSGQVETFIKQHQKRNKDNKI